VRVALVHDWLTGMRGGEKVLLSLARLFPDATLFTLLHVKGSVAPELEAREIRTSFVQRLPGVARHYRSYLPLFPAAIASLDLRDYDLVISSSHCVAKGARRRPGALHVSYCFTPMRYVWDLYDDYFGRGAGLLTRMLMPPLAARLRRWDRAEARTVRFAGLSRMSTSRVLLQPLAAHPLRAPARARIPRAGAAHRLLAPRPVASTRPAAPPAWCRGP